MEAAIKKLQTLLLAIFLALIGFPLLFILFTPFNIYRWIIKKCSKYFRPDLNDMLTLHSGFFSAEKIYSSEDSFNVMVVNHIEGNVSIEQIRKAVERNCLEGKFPGSNKLIYPELKQNITTWAGYSFWTPVKDFKLENQVYVLDKAKEHSNLMNEKKFKKLWKKLIRKPWSKDKPLWEFIVVPNYIPQDDFAKQTLVILRLHHALGDGFSTLKLLLKAFESSSIFSRISQPKYYKPSGIQTFLNMAMFIFKSVYEVAAEIMDSVYENWILWQQMSTNPDLTVTYSNPLPITVLREIQNQHKVEFTSIIFAALAGGVREIIKKYHGGEIPKKIKIGFPLPLPNHPSQLINHFTQGSIMLPVGEADPIKRLKEIQNELQNLKLSTLPLVYAFLSSLCTGLPIFLLKFVKENVKPDRLFISNLPGPSEQFEAFGHTVVDMNFASTIPRTLFPPWAFMFFTYAGRFRLTLGAYSPYLSSVEQAEEFCQLCLQQFNILKHSETS